MRLFYFFLVILIVKNAASASLDLGSTIKGYFGIFDDGNGQSKAAPKTEASTQVKLVKKSPLRNDYKYLPNPKNTSLQTTDTSLQSDGDFDITAIFYDVVNGTKDLIVLVRETIWEILVSVYLSIYDFFESIFTSLYVFVSLLNFSID